MLKRKKYLKSGYDTVQDLKLEPGTYTLVLYVKSMFSNVYTFALGYDIDGPPKDIAWTEYNIDIIQGELCKVWFTFTTKKGMTKLKPIANNHSREFPVYVADLQLTKGNVPVEAGASPFDIDQILDDLHDNIDGIEDFTNEAFRDGLLDREEKTQLRSSLDAMSSIVESAKGSYAKLRLNPYISESTMTSIARRYDALMLAWTNPEFDPRNPFDRDTRGRRKNKGGFKDVILWIVNGDNIIQDYERDEKDRALNAFNTNLFKYNQAEKQVYSDVGGSSVAPKIIDGFWAFWNPKKWNNETQKYGAFEKSDFSAIGDEGHSPFIDVLTNTWWEWNPNLWNPITQQYGDYWDTGVEAKGKSVKSIEIQTTPTSVVIEDDVPNTSWIFVSAKAQNTKINFDSWKFFVDDSLVRDTSSIAFYNEQEEFWTVETNEIMLLYPNAKTLGISVKSTDTPPLTKSVDVPFIKKGEDGLNVATIHLYKRIPEGDIRLWMSTRTFTPDDLDPQQGEWSRPQAMLDSADFDIEFSSKPTNPGTPNGHPNTNPDWSNEVTTDSVWMAISRLEGGDWTPWVVSKIKDGNGLKIIVYTRSDTTPVRPEGGTYEDPNPSTDGWSRGIPEGNSIIYPIRDILKYDFSESKIIEGDMNGWTMNTPSGYDQLYVIGATASNPLDIDEIYPNEWSESIPIGSDGFNSASISLYQRSKTEPDEIYEDCEYTFSTGELRPVPDGWYRSIQSGNEKLWVTTATAISTEPTDMILKGEWSNFGGMAEDGPGSLKSTAFIRTNDTPEAPDGGSYEDPNPETEGWSDGIPNGDERLWASTRIFTSNGLAPQQEFWTKPEVMADSAEFDVEFSSIADVKLRGEPKGHPNTNLDWSNTANESTIWMATSNLKNGVWTPWTISKIKGETGQGSLKSTAFIRTNDTPEAPKGGDYEDPNPETEGWSDGIPAGNERLWASTRIFTSNGLAPQQEFWTKPEVMADSAEFDVEFSSVEEPGIPYGHPNTNLDWSNTANESTIWMATSNLKNGVWTPWTISKIKGEKGNDGAPGAPGTPGAPGLPGQIPIQKEWVEGDTHRNTDEIVDYIYVRGANKEQSYWYKLSAKGTTRAQAPPENGEPRAGYDRIDWLKELAVNVLIAEEANLAGFIFKDNKLISQKGLLDGVVKKYGEIEDEHKDDFIPNIILNGNDGRIKANDAEISGSFETNSNGNRISISKNSQSLRLFGSDGRVLGGITFETREGSQASDAMFYSNYYNSQGEIEKVISMQRGQLFIAKRIGDRRQIRMDETGIYNNTVKVVDFNTTGDGGGGYTHPSTHPASMITTGTFAGIVKANNNTSYTTKQVRNMILSTNNAISSQMANGDIWIKYE